MKKTDVLIIGSGAAGLSYAIKVAKRATDKKITIITKTVPEESNTQYAQGGVAVVLDKVKDNFEQHIEDTMLAGANESTREVVEMVVKDAPTRIMELVDWGLNFDLNSRGEFDLGREGGHSNNRIIHHKDNTGEAIEKVLLQETSKYSNIEFYPYQQAIDIILSTDGRTSLGAEVLDVKSRKIYKIYSNITVLATGGCGQVYSTTSNPEPITGDGIGLAYRTKASISNMQYIQFHPTVVYESTSGRRPLVTEALRGEGAYLLNMERERFMHKYGSMLELACRDVVSRAIYMEMERSKVDYVYLDCRHLTKETLLGHFPNIYNDCLKKGFDLTKDLLPVTPAAHYLCGGVDVNENGETSIKNMYAIGECSNTGLHGANRLASNSLLEALVYGHRAAETTVKSLYSPSIDVIPNEEEFIDVGENKNSELISNLRKSINLLMDSNVSIVRNNVGLSTAQREYKKLESEFYSIYNRNETSAEFENLRNLLCVAQLIIEQSISRKYNAGTFYNKDLESNE